MESWLTSSVADKESFSFPVFLYGFVSFLPILISNLYMLDRKIQTLLDVRPEAKHPLLVGTAILVFLSIFPKSQESSPFEALNSACLSMCQRDVRPPVQKRRRPRYFSRVSTGDSDIPSSYEMKYEPAFKPLQGNPAFF